LKIIEVVLRFPVADSVEVDEAAEFAAEAVGVYGGSKEPPGAYGKDSPGDPLFGCVDVEIVRAKRLARARGRWKTQAQEARA
jgi:hypothetical protein